MTIEYKCNHSSFQYITTQYFDWLFTHYRYNLKFVQKTSESERNERAPSETTDPESDYEEEDFVEALENLDLNQAQNMQLYTSFLEPLVSTSEPEASIMK